ncbi:MAG TPA: ATP-binding protein [Polyangium sp.]|nr:ATP-binding protein [Polyangium sp.]
MNEPVITNGRALIVHDDMDVRHMLAVSMHRVGYEVDFAETAEEAVEKTRTNALSVLITDLHMPGMDDTSMLHEIRRVAPDMSIVVLTAAHSIAPAVDAVRAVADEYVTQPVDPHALHFAVERAVDRKKARAETDLMRRTLAELREAHLALHAERDFVETVLGTIDSLVVVLDLDGTVVHFNAACERTTGMTAQEMRGRTVTDLLLDPEEKAALNKVFEAFRSGQTRRSTYENTWLTKGSERRRITWTNSVLLDELGQVKHIVASGVDVTDVRNMEARVRRSEHLASIATFSAGVAHEIKNPLNAAMLHLQLLNRLLGKTSPDLDAAREAATISVGEIRRVAALLDEFLQCARPEKPRRSLTDLRRICDDVAALCRVEAEAAHIEMQVTGDATLELHADDGRMRQVVLNLVRNALEAVRADGHVQIDVSHADDLAWVRVIDDGPGIVADEVRIFQPFFTTKEKGTGLGLSITHRIVTDHGGDITVQSQPGKTVFAVMLPLTEGARIS